MKEPKRECAFQGDWDEDDEEFECGVHSNSYYCDKSVCPFWKGRRVTVQQETIAKPEEELSFE